MMLKKFTEHPQSLGMTYCQHMTHAANLAWQCNKTALALVVHSVFPFLFTEYASRKIKELAGE
jgi:cobalamin synthase